MKKLKYISLFSALLFFTYCSSDNSFEEAGESSYTAIITTILIIVILIATGLLLWIMGLSLWIRAKFSSVRISLIDLAVMRYKKIPPHEIVQVMIKATEAGIPLSQQKLAAHYLAGGNITKVVNALITAHNADRSTSDKEHLDLTFEVAAAIDLSKVDVEAAVKEAIHYKIYETDPITAYAKDGVELTMRCKVTLRPKIQKIVGGAKAETVLARINEGIASEIGHTGSHYQVLESPYAIAEVVREDAAKISQDTAFEVLSIDISDIKVGKNIHLELDKEKAEAAVEKAKADAEKAKADAEKAKADKVIAEVRFVEAEIEVQKAMAAAFLDGNLTVEEYHKMQNTEADTKMRESLGKAMDKNH